jgi:tetratricopeptide (TPR) repeat protein
MTESNKIDVNKTNNSRISRYSSDSILIKNLELARKISAQSLSPDKKYYYELGVNKYEELNYDEAINCFDKAINLDSNYATAYFCRGRTKFEIKDYFGAIEDWDCAIAIDASSIDTYYCRARAKIQLNDYTGAVKDYDSIITIDPNDWKKYAHRASLKAKAENHLGSVEDYNICIMANPKNSSLYFNRAKSKFELNDYYGVIEDCNLIIQLGIMHHNEAYFQRANAKFKLSDYTGAIKDYNKVIGDYDDPNCLKNPLGSSCQSSQMSEAYLNRAKAKLELNDFTGVIKDCLFNDGFELSSEAVFDRSKILEEAAGKVILQYLNCNLGSLPDYIMEQIVQLDMDSSIALLKICKEFKLISELIIWLEFNKNELNSKQFN